MDGEPLIIGWITRPHGVRGELKVRPDTDFPERFDHLRQVLILERGGPRAVAVESVRRQDTAVLMKLAGVDDLDAARALAGKPVAVPWEERMPLPDGSFYVWQVVGLSVRTTAGEVLGKIAEVFRTGSNDVYRVTGDQGEVFIPATREVVRAVDIERGEIVVDLPEGLR